jgi:hypothetical protein
MMPFVVSLSNHHSPSTSSGRTFFKSIYTALAILETILEKMSSLPKPQKNFADFIDRVDVLARQGDL